jgi:hypothetical protein
MRARRLRNDRLAALVDVGDAARMSPGARRGPTERALEERGGLNRRQSARRTRRDPVVGP